MLHSWDFIAAPKKVKLDFNISTAKWILWLKTIPGKTLQTTEWMTSSGEFWHLCKRFPNLYIKWIQIYRKLDYGRVFCQYPNTINTFQWQICCLNSKTFSKKNFFFLVICNVKRKLKIRYSIYFLVQQKEPLNIQNSLTRNYSTYLRFLEGFLLTTTTTQGVLFHQYIIK